MASVSLGPQGLRLTDGAAGTLSHGLQLLHPALQLAGQLLRPAVDLLRAPGEGIHLPLQILRAAAAVGHLPLQPGHGLLIMIHPRLQHGDGGVLLPGSRLQSGHPAPEGLGLHIVLLHLLHAGLCGGIHLISAAAARCLS